jgi:hypothetical protein
LNLLSKPNNIKIIIYGIEQVAIINSILKRTKWLEVSHRYLTIELNALGSKMNANASKPLPYVPRETLGPEEFIWMNSHGRNLILYRDISFTAFFRLTKVISVPIKGSVIVERLTLGLVGNTLYIDIILSVSFTILILFFQSAKTEWKYNGKIVGSPFGLLRTRIPLPGEIHSGVPPRKRIMSL